MKYWGHLLRSQPAMQMTLASSCFTSGTVVSGRVSAAQSFVERAERLGAVIAGLESHGQRHRDSQGAGRRVAPGRLLQHHPESSTPRSQASSWCFFLMVASCLPLCLHQFASAAFISLYCTIHSTGFYFAVVSAQGK